MYILFLLLTGLITIVFGQGNYPNPVNLDSSNGFSVEYFDNYKIVHNLLNNEKYMLVCCGMALDNNTEYTGVFSTPIQNIAIDSALYTLPFFEVPWIPFLIQEKAYHYMYTVTQSDQSRPSYCSSKQCYFPLLCQFDSYTSKFNKSRHIHNEIKLYKQHWRLCWWPIPHTITG